MKRFLAFIPILRYKHQLHQSYRFKFTQNTRATLRRHRRLTLLRHPTRSLTSHFTFTRRVSFGASQRIQLSQTSGNSHRQTRQTLNQSFHTRNFMLRHNSRTARANPTLAPFNEGQRHLQLTTSDIRRVKGTRKGLKDTKGK